MQHLKRNLLERGAGVGHDDAGDGRHGAVDHEHDERPASPQAGDAEQQQADQAKSRPRSSRRSPSPASAAASSTPSTTKKDSTSIVEAISAEDIGKLPDVSIAESIARLPGLAAQRVAGRAQVISVRGLSPDFSTTLLNGREHGQHRRQPQRRVRPVPVRTDGRRDRLQDAGRRARRPGPVGHHRHAAPCVRSTSTSRSCAVSARCQRQLAGLGRQRRRRRQPLQRQLHRPVRRPHGRLRRSAYSHSDTPIQENQVGLYEPWQAIGDGWRPGVPAGTFYLRRHQGAAPHRLHRARRRDGDAAVPPVATPGPARWTCSTPPPSRKTPPTSSRSTSATTTATTARPAASPTPTINGNNTFIGGTASNVYPLVRGMYNKREDEINALRLEQRVQRRPGRHDRRRRQLVEGQARRAQPGEQHRSCCRRRSWTRCNLDFSSDGFSQLDPGPRLLQSGHAVPGATRSTAPATARRRRSSTS